MSNNLLRPFAGLRPSPEFAQEVIAPPYDVVTTEEARKLAKNKPWSFLHISKPEIDLPSGVDPHVDEVYKKGAENMARMLKKGIICQDDTPSYYIYRIETKLHCQTGVVGAGSVEAYEKNLIRRHELTRFDKETDRVKQIKAVNAQTGPVFTTHEYDFQLSNLIDGISANEPAYSVTNAVGDIHTLWVVNKEQVINRITECFQKIGVIYIADGHHRSAAASRVASERKKSNIEHTGLEAYNTFLIVSFPDTEVQIRDYNRVVKGLNGLSPSKFLNQIKKSFEIFTTYKPAQPVERKSFGMYLEGQWYSLKFREQVGTPESIIDNLDVNILMHYLLSPILGIGDARTDPRIDFVGGSRGMAELQSCVDTGNWSVAFSLFPISMKELKQIADDNQTMPPKTTWFEPKLADGLVSLILD